MKLLVAGIGNIFFGDDGFGPEVAQVLAAEPIDGVKIEDYGIRGLHLAFELVAGYDRAILIDAVPRGGVAGTLYVVEPELCRSTEAPDAHRMDLQNVFAFVQMIGGAAPPITIVGCEPSAASESIGLSPPVREAVVPVAAVIRRLVAEALAGHDVFERRSTV